MLVSAFYDLNTACAENTEHVTLYLTFHKIPDYTYILFNVFIVTQYERFYVSVLLHL